MAELKTVAHILTTGRFPVEIKLAIAVDRDFSQEEQFEISDLVTKIRNVVHKNSMLCSESMQEEIRTEKAALLALFGDNKIYVKEIPNQYYPDSVFPWFTVYTTKGPIRIGWRKRVINIDWSESNIPHFPEDLFAGEDTTIGSRVLEDRYIHAWGYEKAKEYIDKLLKS